MSSGRQYENTPAWAWPTRRTGGWFHVRRWMWLVAPLAALLTACGGITTIPTASNTVAHWHTTLLARAETTHTLAAVIRATRTQAGVATSVTADVKTANRRVFETVSSSGGTPVTTIDDGTNVWTYQSGGSQYAVQASLPTTGYGFRWLTYDWATFLQSVRFLSSRSVHGGTQLTFRGTLAGSAASGTLTVSSALNPERLVLHSANVTITQSVVSYQPGAVLASNTFQFLPPAGVTALNTTPSVLASLTTASASVSYSLVVPTVRAGMLLTGVRVVTSPVYGRELLMQYQGPNGGPVLMTEWQSGPKNPYPASSATDVVVNGRTVAERPLGDGGVYAAVTVAGTAVVVEGTSGAVAAMLSNLTVGSA